MSAPPMITLARNLGFPHLSRVSRVRFLLSKPIAHSSRSLTARSNSTSSEDPPKTLSDRHLYLVSTLKRVLEKKAVKVLNDIKRPETPWEVYDLATSVEYEMVKRNGHSIPIHLSKSMKKSIIKRDFETQKSRLKIYGNFRDKEKLEDDIALLKLEKKQQNHLETAKLVKEIDSSLFASQKFHNAQGRHVLGPNLALLPGSGLNCMKKTEKMSVGNLNYAMRFGQHFAIDLDLPYEMMAKETHSLHSQMREVYRVNRWLWEPYNIHLCGYKSDNLVMKDMVTSFDDYLWNVTPECVTRVFPKERLVYLSPDSPNVLTEYSHEDVYILGALIDKRIPKKYSYDKAQRLGIRSARLDLDSFLELTRQKPPYLAFSDVFNVMVDARDTGGNWFFAFQNLITGRKRILRWRDEFEDAAPEPEQESLHCGLDSPLHLREDFRYKCFEKLRSIMKPPRQHFRQDSWDT